MQKLFIIFIFILCVCITGAFAILYYLPEIEPHTTVTAPIAEPAEIPEPESKPEAIPHITPAPVEPEAEHPAPAEPVIHNLRLAAAGDLMLHGTQHDHAYDPQTGSYNFNPPFEIIAPYIQTADIALANLETVFSGQGFADYPLFSAPYEYGYAIKNAGFDVLTTANNHILDKREQGLINTLNFLDETEIHHTGAARSFDERDNILIIEKNNIRLAILSYTYGTNGIPIPRGKEYLVNLLDKELIASDIARAKEQNPDFIIISPHMGDEYQQRPSANWQGWAKYMFEQGADIILAHHPHVIQPVEIFEVEENGQSRVCIIAYSLGNFISGQRTIPRDEGVILNIDFEKQNNEKAYITRVSFIPTWVLFTNTSGNREIRILPIGEIIQKKDDPALMNANPSPANAVIPRIRPNDITRMRTAMKNITSQIMGDTPDDVLIEYTVYQR